MKYVLALGITFAASAAAAAQASPRADANSFTSDIRRDYRTVRDYFVRAAEKMPGDKYAFRPSPDVRTFAQQIAHVADDQYNLCAPAQGAERNAAYRDIESRLSTKAELVTALKDAFAYCDKVYDATTDAASLAPPNSTMRPTRFSYLNWNLWHTWEHYGNIVVYLRMNGLVPPSSEGSQMQMPAAKPPASE